MWGFGIILNSKCCERVELAASKVGAAQAHSLGLFSTWRGQNLKARRVAPTWLLLVFRLIVLLGVGQSWSVVCSVSKGFEVRQSLGSPFWINYPIIQVRRRLRIYFTVGTASRGYNVAVIGVVKCLKRLFFSAPHLDNLSNSDTARHV